LSLATPQPRRRLIVGGPLTIEVGPELETCLVRLWGELDMAGAPALERELLRLLVSRLHTVVLDLHDLEFIDAAGLRCLVTAARRSAANGDQLRILGPQEQVARIFGMTGTDHLLPLIAG
jgi:anti-sigma B factor antagonist